MQRVSNKECAEQFAHNALTLDPTEVRGHGNMYIQGRTIYSYGSHHPIATITKRRHVRLNIHKYSSTTSKHTGYVRMALVEAGVVIEEYDAMYENDPAYRAKVDANEERSAKLRAMRTRNLAAREGLSVREYRSLQSKRRREQTTSYLGDRRINLGELA